MPTVPAHNGKRHTYIPLLATYFKGRETSPSSTMHRDVRTRYLPVDGAVDNDSLHETQVLPQKPARRHPFASGFEAPDWWPLLIHFCLCLVAYPVLRIVLLIAQNRPLFWARFVVSLGCGLIGFALGLSLLNLSQKHLEAAAWATVIHQSRMSDGPGVKIKDLAAHTADPTGSWAALRLLWDRYMYAGTSRENREHYDRRPWSLVILFFLLLVLAVTSLPFVLGRLVIIETYVQHQRESYTEIAVKGDLSDADIARAATLKPAFTDFTLTWTLAPFSDHGGLPPVITFQSENDTVFFAETILSQLQPNGSGFGTFEFNTNATTPTITTAGSETSGSIVAENVDPGGILRFPRWGTRLHCVKTPDGNTNIIPRSPNAFTYLFTPESTLRSLFASFNMEYKGVPPFNASQTLKLNDTLPSGSNASDIALGGAFYDNGVAHSFMSTPLTTGEEGTGWITIEHVLVRLNTSYTPNGKFQLYSDLSVPDEDGNPTRIGYDAAVCLQLIEPWILETYNNTVGLPNSIRLVEPGNIVRDKDTETLKEKRIGSRLTDPSVNRQLTSSKLADVYLALHQNSVNQILKDNGRDAFYVPSPTVVSFTNGSGPMGYTELSESFFAQARGQADASNTLPYFIGWGQSLARLYPDLVLSRVSFNTLAMVVYLLGILILGTLAGLFVPRLPLGVARRAFDVYSWMAAFHADELVGNDQIAMINKNMELGDIEHRMGGVKLRYVNPA